jgi:hypothetical protein
LLGWQLEEEAWGEKELTRKSISDVLDLILNDQGMRRQESEQVLPVAALLT